MTTADELIVAGAAAIIRGTIRDQHGEPVVADGTVTVDLTRADGTVIDTGRETDGADNEYTAALTAEEAATLDLIRADWKDGTTVRATTHIEVAGGVYWTVGALRAFDSSLDDAGRYDDASIRAVRREVEAECEHEKMTGTAWVRRYRHAHVHGSGTSSLLLPDWNVTTVRSVTIATAGHSETLEGGQVAAIRCYETGLIERLDGIFPWGADVTVGYEHGYDQLPPDLRRATMQRARYRLNMELTGDLSGMERVTFPDGSSTQVIGPEDMEQRRVVSTYHRHAKRTGGVG